MQPYRMMFRLERNRVRLLLTAPSGDELLRASLPQPAVFWSGKPATALMESLAIWLNTRLHVVFSADNPSDGFSLELTDELGTGQRTVFYEVVAAKRAARRPTKLRGVDDFRDLHQLCLLDRIEGGGR